MTEKMTVHQALCEIKVSDKKLSKVFEGLDVVAANRANAKKVNGIDPTEYANNAKSEYQKALDLIKRNVAIKKAVNEYNAKTIITVGGKDYSVAQAIYMMQHGISEKKSLIKVLTNRLRDVELRLHDENGRSLDEAAERNAVIQFGSAKENKKAAEYLDFINNYKEQNQYVLVDPLNIREEIEKLQDDVDAFESNVDSAIQVSNATTEITIEY